MKFRLQYSLLTLLILTAASGIVISYFVIPWRHDLQQADLIERLIAYEDGVYNLKEIKKNSYELELWGSEPKHFDFFLEHAVNCERVQAISSTYENFTTEQLARLKKLPRLEKIHLKDCDIDAQRMKYLGLLPIKELYLGYLNKLSFDNWPIQPHLELLTTETTPDFDAPPLEIINHPKLRELNLDCVPQLIRIENCPELKVVAIDDYVVTKLKLKNLPKLETLTLCDGIQLDSESQIEELPTLQNLSIYPSAFRHFQHHKLLRLQNFDCTGGEATLDKEVMERILHLPELEGLKLENDWSVLMSNGLRIPIMPRLKRLNLEGNYSSYQVPEQLVLQFLQQCPSLELISLSLENASDTLLQKIALQENLQSLNLNLKENGKLGDTSVLNNCKKIGAFMLNGKYQKIAPPVSSSATSAK